MNDICPVCEKGVLPFFSIQINNISVCTDCSTKYYLKQQEKYNKKYDKIIKEIREEISLK